MIGLSLVCSAVVILVCITGISYAVFRVSRKHFRRSSSGINRYATFGAAAVGVAIFSVLLFLVYHLDHYPGMPLFGVSRGAMVGTWAPPPASQQATSDESFGYYSRTFVFRAEGSFEMAPTEGIKYSCDPTEGTTGCAGFGTWDIESFVGEWWVRLSFAELDGLPADKSVRLSIGRLLPPYRIYRGVGDPDSNDIIYLTKVKTRDD